MIETSLQFNRELLELQDSALYALSINAPALTSVCKLSPPFSEALRRATQAIQRDAFARGWRARGKETDDL